MEGGEGGVDLCCEACVELMFVGLTSEDGAELGPAGDPSFGRVLAQCDLQEEDGQAAPEQEDEVGDEERTCVMDEQ